MSSVSRRESPLASPDLPVPEASPSPTDAVVPSARTGPGPGAPARNAVEAYRAPVGPRPSEGPVVKEAGGGLTAGQLARGGARARESLQAEAIYADLQALLRTDWKDWSITHDDRRRVHQQLERLSPADYRHTVARMERDGLLGRYLAPGEMAEPATRAFLNQAERMGLVTRESGPKAPEAAGRPPEGPLLHVNDAALPGSVRQVLHASNLRAKQAYGDAHQAYVGRYAELAMRAGSLLELRALGEPVHPFSLSEPGVTAAHPDARALRASWAGVSVPDGTLPAYRAVEARLRELSGAQRAGTLQLRQEVEGGFKGGGGAVKLVREDTLSGSGAHGATTKGAGELEGGGLKVAVERDTTGAEKTKGGVALEGGGVSVDSEGTVRLELSAPGRKDAAAYAEFNPARGTFGGGVSVKGEVLGGHAQLEYGVTMQGARPERAQDVASREPGTVFGPLPELERGVAWEALPAERRARMVRDGWSAGSWAEALRWEAVRR